MAIAVGNIEYSLGAAPVTGCGFSWCLEELDEALAGPVGDVVFDVVGTKELGTLLASLPDTGFEPAAISAVLTETRPPEDWRVGEALAETYLTHHRNCYFPWPDGRDERKSGSSLPGADLVGFQSEAEGDRFAFGEVKTSIEEKYPPGLMYGDTGLKQQLEDLQAGHSLRLDLVKYLAYRASFASWSAQFKRAVARFLKDSEDVCVFGVLVRDVEPNQDDLRVRVAKLHRGCPTKMEIELLAVYLPSGSIPTLSDKVSRLRVGGET